MYNKNFSHIYVEYDAFKHPVTQSIIEKFPNAQIIMIQHYKDIFCRKHQNFSEQKKSQALILAMNREKSVYKGAKVCQDFGNEYFYYCSNVKNCIYDCEYCYLKGMYPSGNIVVFVNLESIFKEVGELLSKHPVYLCISYDTDLAALDGITGFLGRWADFASGYENLEIEVRSKSGIIVGDDSWIQNFIFAWTISPQSIIKQYEHGTASLTARLHAINMVLNKSGRIHLCFDPVIYCEDFEKVYGEMFDEVFENIDMSKVEGVSTGTFRISKSYMKNMRRQGLSAITAFPYQCTDGVYQYGDEINHRVMGFVLNRLKEVFDASKIFVND